MTEHSHAHAAGHGVSASTDRRRLIIAAGIIGLFVVVQFVGALASGSLALLADTGHMASDLLALIVALVAAHIALRPPTNRHTYGFRRFEVFGAAVNATLLVIAGVAVAVGSVSRLLGGEPPEVQSMPMLVVAIVGLAANVAALLVLQGGRRGSMNLRGAYLHVLGDSLGSVMVIVAAVVIQWTGFMAADAIASLCIAALLIPRGIALLWQAQGVLSESAPDPAAVEQMREHLLHAPGVLAVHDVHAWQLTEGEVIVTAHVQVQDSVFRDGNTSTVLTELAACLEEHFGVRHTTMQLEPEGYRAGEADTHH